jgi:hypothetical protein
LRKDAEGLVAAHRPESLARVDDEGVLGGTGSGLSDLREKALAAGKAAWPTAAVWWRTVALARDAEVFRIGSPGPLWLCEVAEGFERLLGCIRISLTSNQILSKNVAIDKGNGQVFYIIYKSFIPVVKNDENFA